MRLVGLSVGSVTYDGVHIPITFGERLRGKRRITAPMLFGGTSVHGIGMDRPIVVIAIDSMGRVVAVHRLDPGRVFRHRRAHRLLEVEVTAPVPVVGDRVGPYDPPDGGTAGGVRDSDREPGRRLRAARPDPS